MEQSEIEETIKYTIQKVKGEGGRKVLAMINTQKGNYERCYLNVVIFLEDGSTKFATLASHKYEKRFDLNPYYYLEMFFDEDYVVPNYTVQDYLDFANKIKLNEL